MSRHWCRSTCLAVASLTALARAAPQDPQPSATPGAADRVATVERGPFVLTLDLAGVFHERNPVVVAYRPEADQGPVEVVEAVAPGRVEKGQILVRLRSASLEQRIPVAAVEVAVDRVELQRLQQELQRAEEVRQLQLARADLSIASAERARDALVEIDAPERLHSSEENVRNWDAVRQEAEETFRVLCKMYEADGVIETAERMDIDSNKRNLDRGRDGRPRVVARHDILKNLTIPREVAALELAVRKAKYEQDLLRATSSLQVEQQRHELERRELGLRRKQAELDRLLRDLAALTVAAPKDGHAIAGHYDGKWSALAEAGGLRPGAKIAARQVLYTIVQPAPKDVRAAVPEAMRSGIAQDLAATLVPTALLDVTLPARVTRVDDYPVDGKYGVWLRASTRHERLLPGSSCRVRITVRDNPEALTVAARAVERRPGGASVVVCKDGVQTRRAVEVGWTSGGRTEILAGVAAGEQVLVSGGSQ